jgi:uncharacterized membrane protein YuzA (DUF378 family)
MRGRKVIATATAVVFVLVGVAAVICAGVCRRV